MTYAPNSLIELDNYLESRGVVPLGIVGNTKHCKGYHLGRDRIFGSCACKPSGICKPGLKTSDYSVQGTRDKFSLTDAASAIDIGKINGSYQELRTFSIWFADQCLAGAVDTYDVKEFIFSPDGINVFGWVAGNSYLIPNYGDSSHRQHSHTSFFRDSQLRSKLAVYRRYFEVESMIKAVVRQLWQPTINPVTGVSNGVLRATPDRNAPVVKRVPEGTIITTIAEVRTIAGADGNWRLVETSDKSLLYMLRSDWTALSIIPTVGV